jgi:hypothetical protein
MSGIRPCRDDELQTILGIVNAAAEAYSGVIPDDCWHDPYRPLWRCAPLTNREGAGRRTPDLCGSTAQLRNG